MAGSRTSLGRALVIGAGSALLATAFAPLWASYRIPGLDIVPPETVHRNAFAAYGIGMELALLLAFLAVVVAALGALRPQALPERPLLLVLCSGTTVLLVWQAIAGPEGSSNPNGYGIGRGVLAFTGPLLAACTTYGAHLVGGKPTRRRRVGDDVSRAPGRTSRGE